MVLKPNSDLSTLTNPITLPIPYLDKCANNDDPIHALRGYVYSSQAGRYYRPYKDHLNFWDAQAR